MRLVRGTCKGRRFGYALLQLSMKVLTVFVVWLLATVLAFGTGIAAIACIGKLTHSGFGSCGPYGPAFGLLEGRKTKL